MIDLIKLDTEEKVYVVGFIAADGGVVSSGKSRKVLSIQLSNKDKGHLELLRDIIKPDAKLYVTKGDTSLLSVSSVVLYEQLESHGIVPNKTFIIEPPHSLPDNLIRHYVRGYFDGDGTVYVTNKRLRCGITSGSEKMLVFIKENFDDFRDKAHTKFFKSMRSHKINKESNWFTLKYSGRNAVSFLRWIYNGANIYLNRKHELALPYIEGSIVLKGEWDEKEMCILEEMYPSAKKEELLKRLHKRTWKSICEKARRLGIRREKFERDYELLWTEEERQFLREHFESKSKEFLLDGLPLRSWAAIGLEANRNLKLYRRKK